MKLIPALAAVVLAATPTALSADNGQPDQGVVYVNLRVSLSELKLICKGWTQADMKHIKRYKQLVDEAGQKSKMEDRTRYDLFDARFGASFEGVMTGICTNILSGVQPVGQTPPNPPPMPADNI